MVTVTFPPHLLRHYSIPRECAAQGSTVAELLHDLERQYPGVTAYLLDDTGALRQHVNIFLGNTLLRDRKSLSDRVTPEQVVSVMQALSGG